MKRILMTGVIVVTAATAGYFFTQNTTSNEHSVLNYIPKNTPIFSGQLTPFPIKTYINAIADTYSTPPNEIMNSIYASENYDPDNSRVNFF